MHWEFHSQLENITGDTLHAIVNCALGVAAADGTFTYEEIGEVAQSVSEILGGYSDADTIAEILNVSLERLFNEGASNLFAEAGGVIQDEGLRAVAMIAAGATAWKRNGINTKEGLAFQEMARHLGFEPGTNAYFQLLADAKHVAS